MDIESIVKNACARASVSFQNAVDLETQKLTSGDQGEFNFSIARCQAIEKSLPSMLETALTLALTEIFEKMEENR